VTLVRVHSAPITPEGHKYGTVWTDGDVFGELMLTNEDGTAFVRLATGTGSVTFKVDSERIEVMP